MTEHRSLVVTARLTTPLSIERPIHLEGILYDVRFKDDPETMGQPLRSLSYRDGVPLASAGILVSDGLGGVAHGTENIIKSVNLRNRNADSIAPPSGRAGGLSKIGSMSPYRNRIREYPTMSGISSVTWFAVGDVGEVARAVERVPGIGALRNRGFGEVSDWTVEEAGFAPDLVWYRPDGIMRRLPTEAVRSRFGSIPSGCVIGWMRVEPPLWVRAETVEVAFPSIRFMTMGSSALRSLRG